jgi:sporulation protein YunB
MRKYRYRRRKWGVPLLLLLVAVLLIYGIQLFEKRVRPTIEAVAESKAKSVATRAIADAVNDVMAGTGTQYDDLIIFQKNSYENITAVTSNIIAINSLKSVLTKAIEKKISTLNDLSVKIPVSNFFGQSILSGIGPKIKIRMVPVGYTEIEVENCFSSGGINQTKHEIYMNVKCSVSVLLPISTKTADITTQIPIA